MAETYRHGQRLREIRQHRGMSQRLLARSIDVSVGTVQNYERGRALISADRLDQLAHALRCQPAELLQRPGSSLPKYRFGAQRKDVSQELQRQNALDHLAAIWNDLRDELLEEKGIDVGHQPARDWTIAIKMRMGVAGASRQLARQAYDRIRKRLEAYHELLKRESKSYDQTC